MAADQHGGKTALTPEEMRVWYAEEIRDVLKECELRIRDATEFTTGYLAGELTSGEANSRLRRYDARWGEPLGGVFASSYQNDEDIVKAIDKGHRNLERARTHAERIGKRNPSAGPRR